MSAVHPFAHIPQPAANDASGAHGFDIDVTEVETVLGRSDSIALGKYRCRIEHPRFSGGGPQRCPYIVFPRSSVRITRLHGAPLVYTPNTISFHEIGDVYQRSAISEDGERCDWIAIAPALLRDIAARHDAAAAGRERLFAARIAPSTGAVYLAQRALFRAVREDPGIDMLQVEEHVIAIVDAIYAAALRGTRRPGRARRDTARAPKIVDAAVALLAGHYAATLGIAQISRQVHASASYLAREFRRRTGFSLHDYQQQLRLRAALDLMPGARGDLTALAVHLGFSSHSHFTCVFRRKFGMTPTGFCATMSSRRVRELRAKLAVR